MTAFEKGPLPLDPRWFKSDGLHMVIDRSSSSILPELGVPASEQSIVSDLVDAVLLDEQGPLLRCLDDWCDTAIDWQPLGPVGQVTSQEAEPNALQGSVNAHNPVYLHELQNYPTLTVSLTSLEGTPRTIWLAMNAEALESLPELPEKWEALVKINRHLLPHTLELQKYKLSTEELSKVGPGSLLLLSQSFQDHWQATASAAEASLSKLDVIIATTDQVIRIAPQASITNDADIADHASEVLVELADSFMINELYMRSVWQAGLTMVLPLPNALDGTRVVVRQAVAAQAMPFPSVWAGSLMKVGEGFGVLLNSSIDQQTVPPALAD